MNKRFSSITINATVRKVQKQLSRTLFAQSLVPLLTSILPRTLPIFMTHFKISIDYAGEAVKWVF